MTDSNRIFRKVSLERLSSPEQLDVLMQATSPKGWVALLALCGLLVMIIGWGFFGTIPTSVTGTCILIRPGGVSEIVAPGAGQITDISVEVGDTVSEGQMIARIEHHAALGQIKSAEAKLHELKAQEARLGALNNLSNEQQAALLSESEKSLNNRIRIGDYRLKSLAEKVESQASLLEQGLITKQTLLSTKLEYANVKLEIENSRNDIRQLEVRRTEARKQLQNEQNLLTIQINEVTRNLANQMRDTRETALVFSPYNGRILEIRLAENTFVTPGMPILTIEQTGESVTDLEARIYIDALNGKKVKPNMDVQISPSTVMREEFGYMIGKIRTVADFPSTPQGMMRILNNETLVKELAAGAAPIAAQADLIPSSLTTSGYKWSSPKGPETRIESGTLCSASVTIKKQRPISLVIPILREDLGL